MQSVNGNVKFTNASKPETNIVKTVKANTQKSSKKNINSKNKDKKIVIKDPIKNIGEYTVELKLFEGVVAKLKLIIEEEN